MRTLTSSWSRYVNGLFGTRRAVAPLRKADRRPRRRASELCFSVAEVLEHRELLSGFTFADFNSTNAAALNLVGTAAVTTDNKLELTPPQDRSIGGAWYTADKSLVAGNFQTTS